MILSTFKFVSNAQIFVNLELTCACTKWFNNAVYKNLTGPFPQWKNERTNI